MPVITTLRLFTHTSLHNCVLASRSATAASPAKVRDAIPCTNTGPMTNVAAHLPTTGTRSPSHKCTIRTCVPPDVGENDHSTSISLVIPPTCGKRIAGLSLSTAISEIHQVGQLIRNNGPLAVRTM